MKKTTVYLPDDLKQKIERAARTQRRSEADVIRDAILRAVAAPSAPAPRVPLVAKGLGDRTIAERADDHLGDFGR